MKVVEIFDSMQGEGEYMGVMCTFVRFPGCNLQCPFCDEHEKYSKAVEMDIPDIVAKCNYNIVVLTGGEPTLQPLLNDLVDALHAAYHLVHIETNGTNLVPKTLDWVTCSPKAPLFNMTCRPNEVKLVVDEDLNYNKAVAITLAVRDRVWLQPCDGPWIEESKKRITEWIAKSPDLFRAGIQLHKYYEVQ